MEIMQPNHVTAETGVPATDRTGKYLCFLLGERSYGLSIIKVKEIIEYSEITPLPMMPDFFRGAINLRGRVVPVIDLAQRLDQGETRVERRTCILITELRLRDEHLDVGLLVDGVSQVADIGPGQIEAAPSFAGSLDTRFMHGVGKVGEGFVILLNIDCVFSFEELQSLRRAESLSAGPELQADAPTGD